MPAESDGRIKRRLAAVLAEAGYSRLIAANEEGTLKRLNAHRVEVIDPEIAEHGSRIVKTMVTARWSLDGAAAPPLHLLRPVCP